VESQVQYYAPLAFEPKRLTFGDTEASGLTQEDLTVFVNSAEWTLGQYCITINGVNT
jgi:phosphatidylinositol glycan class S